MQWTEQLERAVLREVLRGDIGDIGHLVSQSLFSGCRAKLFGLLRDHFVKHGVWPETGIIADIARQDPEIRTEYRRIQMSRTDTCEVAKEELLPIIRKRALYLASIQLSELAEQDYSEGDARKILDDALSAGKKPASFSYAENVTQRHRPATESMFVSPTGVEGLDTITEGGLRAGSLGLILGPTKRGKSHVAIAFGAAALRASQRVLHVTLELSAEETACRYDRNLLKMDKYEMLERLPELETRLRSAINPENLKIISAPRFGLGCSDIRKLATTTRDQWGTAFLLVVDYGALLRPTREDVRYAQIGRIHEELSSIAQELCIPIWCPYQTNRTAIQQERQQQSIGMECVGDSYESVQHADLIMALQQTDEDWKHNRLKMNIIGARYCGTGTAMVTPDWTRSTIMPYAQVADTGAS